MSGSRIEEAAARAAEQAVYLDMRLSGQDCSEAEIARALLLIAELDGTNGIARKRWVSPITLRRQLNGMRQRYSDAVVNVMQALRLRMRVEIG